MTSLLFILFLDDFPIYHVKSRHSGSLLNDVFMEQCTKEYVFKYLDTPVTCVDLNNWQIIFSKINKLYSIGHRAARYSIRPGP